MSRSKDADDDFTTGHQSGHIYAQSMKITDADCLFESLSYIAQRSSRTTKTAPRLTMNKLECCSSK
eukprot:scaffold234798_cov43-Prasinocladus_malaysianus.AAC.1